MTQVTSATKVCESPSGSVGAPSYWQQSPDLVDVIMTIASDAASQLRAANQCGAVGAADRGASLRTGPLQHSGLLECCGHPVCQTMPPLP